MIVGVPLLLLLLKGGVRITLGLTEVPLGLSVPLRLPIPALHHHIPVPHSLMNPIMIDIDLGSGGVRAKGWALNLLLLLHLTTRILLSRPIGLEGWDLLLLLLLHRNHTRMTPHDRGRGRRGPVPSVVTWPIASIVDRSSTRPTHGPDIETVVGRETGIGELLTPMTPIVMDRVPWVTVGVRGGAVDGRRAGLVVVRRSIPEVWNVGVEVGGHVVVVRGGGGQGCEGRRIQLRQG
jgi:hypothetical protein